MKRLLAVTAAIALVSLGSLAQAGITIDTVAVADPGNAGELSGHGAGGYGQDRICGAVGYNYKIGKYEVTAKQYTAFLNAVAATDTYGLYNADMASLYWWGCCIKRTGTSGSYTYSVANNSSEGYWANKPVNYVSYWDSCRFANWLQNGQPTGLQTAATTERGAYTLDGYNGSDGRTIGRNVGARWAVASEDEWYKAAYYKGGTSGGYWDYPMQSDIPTVPSNDLTNPDGGNNANFYQNGRTMGEPYQRTDVGEFENSESAYGTFDQGGNVWEWDEALTYPGHAYRGVRGASFVDQVSSLQAFFRYDVYSPNLERYDIGFRLSQIPEPSSIIALLGGLVGLLGIRRRKA